RLSQSFEFSLGNIQFEEFLLVNQPRLCGRTLCIEQVDEIELAFFEAGLHQSQRLAGLRQDAVAIIGDVFGGFLITLLRVEPLTLQLLSDGLQIVFGDAQVGLGLLFSSFGVVKDWQRQRKTNLNNGFAGLANATSGNRGPYIGVWLKS